MRVLKRVLLGIMVVLCCICTMVSVRADVSEDKEWSYEVLDKGEKTCEISRYKGNKTELIVPDELNGYKVTSIGWYAFSGCSGLTSITIPEGVTSIGHFAFDGCSGLTSITIPEGVTSIGVRAFYNCSSLLSIDVDENNVFFTSDNGVLYNNDMTEIIAYPAGKTGKFDIPEGVTSIGYEMFYGCSGLTGITIPEGVTSIGNHAFYGCSGLTSITIPEGVTSIGDGAFEGCSGLTSIRIPEGVTSIGGYAFLECSGLTSITIPEGVTSIGNYAFYGCSGLTSITIPEGVTSIGNYAFYGCSGLTSITIPEGVTSMGGGVFGSCSSLLSIDVDENNVFFTSDNGVLYNNDMTEIRAYPAGKTGEFDIPEGVTNIGNYAFCVCSGLTSITIPEGVTSIGDDAFYGCSGLTSITIPESVKGIGHDAFNGCSGLSSINNKSAVGIAGTGTWYDIDGNICENRIPPQKTVMTKEAYENAAASVMVKGDVSLQYKKSGEGTYTVRLLCQIPVEQAKGYAKVGVDMTYEGGKSEKFLGTSLYTSFLAAGEIVSADTDNAYIIVQLRNVPADAVFSVTPIAEDKLGNIVDLGVGEYPVDMRAVVSAVSN